METTATIHVKRQEFHNIMALVTTNFIIFALMPS